MERYDKFIDLPHPDPQTRPRMARLKRAAQFAPFAALDGYDAAVAEEGRRTQARPILSDHMADLLNQRLRDLMAPGRQGAKLIVTYFKADPVKEGGHVYQVQGGFDQVDLKAGHIHFQGGPAIPLQDLLTIEGDFLEAEAYDIKKRGGEDGP